MTHLYSDAFFFKKGMNKMKAFYYKYFCYFKLQI